MSTKAFFSALHGALETDLGQRIDGQPVRFEDADPIVAISEYAVDGFGAKGIALMYGLAPVEPSIQTASGRHAARQVAFWVEIIRRRSTDDRADSEALDEVQDLVERALFPRPGDPEGRSANDFGATSIALTSITPQPAGQDFIAREVRGLATFSNVHTG